MDNKMVQEGVIEQAKNVPQMATKKVCPPRRKHRHIIPSI